MRLVINAGNTAIKAGLAHDGGIWLQERIGSDAAALEAFITPHRNAIDEAVVLGGGRTETIVAAVLARQGLTVRSVGRELPLPQVGQYASLGHDRIVAGLVAVAQERRALIVVDAGTAVTLTAWRCPAAFAGGLILPGAHACALGLHTAAPALPLVEPAPGPAAAHATIPAIAHALALGHPAMVAACLEALRRDTGIDHLIATGGGAPALVAAGVVPALAVRPSLVLEGVEFIARLRNI